MGVKVRMGFSCFKMGYNCGPLRIFGFYTRTEFLDELKRINCSVTTVYYGAVTLLLG
jgi:hypothetical protein